MKFSAFGVENGFVGGAESLLIIRGFDLLVGVTKSFMIRKNPDIKAISGGGNRLLKEVQYRSVREMRLKYPGGRCRDDVRGFVMNLWVSYNFVRACSVCCAVMLCHRLASFCNAVRSYNLGALSKLRNNWT